MPDDIWIMLNSDLALLVIGLVGTGIVGSILNARIQAKAWERQKQHDILVRTLSEGKLLFDEVTELLSKRSFGLRRVYWELKDTKHSEKVPDIWKEYYGSVSVWNERLQSMRFRIEAIAGDDVANLLLDYADNISSVAPRSLHYKIRQAHSAVNDLMNETDEDAKNRLINQADDLLDRLQAEIEGFLKTVSGVLLYSEKTLKQQVSAPGET